jgi:hypothetical protein
MSKLTLSLCLLLTLLGAAAPAHAGGFITLGSPGGTKSPGAVQRVRDSVRRFVRKHPGKIALGSLALGATSTYGMHAAQGTPLKVVAGGVAVASLVAAIRKAKAWAEDIRF